MPIPVHPSVSPGVTPPEFGVWQRLFLYSPVAICTGGALVVALRALPLAGVARVVFALAVAVNVGLLALSSWSGVLGFIASIRRSRLDLSVRK